MEAAWEFWLACRGFDLEKVEKMLKEGFNPNVRPEQILREPGAISYGYPLLYATATGRVDLLTLLCQYGADLEVTEQKRIHWCSSDTTALHLAVYYGHDDVFDFLIERGANPLCLVGGDDLSILDIAVWKTNHYVFDWVVDRPELLKTLGHRTTSKGGNLFHFAAMQNDPHIVEKITLHCGNLNIDKEDPQGFTPLILAVMHGNRLGNSDSLKALIRAGADVNYRNSKSETALSNAREIDFLNAIQILIDEGASDIFEEH